MGQVHEATDDKNGSNIIIVAGAKSKIVGLNF